ncbi:hypothetical protein MSAN_00902500 [Mycena sanguinolenta]|uniref:F-box domain-containing protein n=1 Tax=Mycena sanguinolenta TaxID=230812 RepID=A0A8H6YZ49_9AGAR|nr:hypothetical protein MSAN_00902500 [Mycena sanguinolenta]
MSSPFASRLGTNYCPRDDELVQIKGFLVEPCMRLMRLEDEIVALQKTMDKLTEERDTVAAFVEAHKALTSPLRRLPLDIIEELFMACLPTNRNCVMSATEAPVLLGRVCSSWRTISLSSPRLWSRLHIVEPTRPYSANPNLYEIKVAQRLEVAKTWLQRSGTCPLSISLESNLDHGISPPLTPTSLHSFPGPYSFLNVLIPLASRWQNIRLTIPPPALETLSALTERDVPLLKYFKLVQRPDQPNSDTKWALPSGILCSPNLSRISLLGGNTNPLRLPLRWNQLTALSLMGPAAWGLVHAQTCHVVLDILSRCPKIETCKLLVQGPPEGDLPHSIVECPCLHTVELMCVGNPLLTAGIVLTRLSLPELRDFKLSGLGELVSVFAGESLVSSLAASARLERISIHSNTFSKPFLHDFLRGLPPTIRYLHITEPVHMWRPSMVEAPLDDEVFGALNASYFPALEELAIHSCRMVSDEALLQFILSRATTLKLVDIKFDREREVDIYPHLEPFLEAGGKASITYITLIPPQFSPWMGLPDAPPLLCYHTKLQAFIEVLLNFLHTICVQGNRWDATTICIELQVRNLGFSLRSNVAREIILRTTVKPAEPVLL